MRAALVVFGALLAAVSSAQFTGDPRDYTRDNMTATGQLMSQGDLKKELALDKDQDKKVSALAKAHQKKMGEITGRARSAGSDFGKMTQMMADMHTLNEETDKAIRAELKPEQDRRLNQVIWQVRGNNAIYDPLLQKEIGLSEEQVGQLNEWKSGASGRMMEAMGSARSATAFKDAEKKLKAQDEAEIAKILTAEQKEKYKAALGPESKAAKKYGERLF